MTPYFELMLLSITSSQRYTSNFLISVFLHEAKYELYSCHLKAISIWSKCSVLLLLLSAIKAKSVRTVKILTVWCKCCTVQQSSNYYVFHDTAKPMISSTSHVESMDYYFNSNYKQLDLTIIFHIVTQATMILVK